MGNTVIVKSYIAATEKAYIEYAEKLQHAGRIYGQLHIAAMANGGMTTDIQSAAGRLGARLGAAGKRAAREIIFESLKNARDNGMDVTPTVVLRVSERIIGRGVSAREANKVFGQPGRTAANKSPINQADLVGLESQIKQEITELKEVLSTVRETHRLLWLRSPQRRTLINEWRAVFGRQPEGDFESV